MLRFYASIPHICGGRITIIVGSGRTIVITAIGESSDAIGEDAIGVPALFRPA
jgi:hypothetical protein